MPFKNNQYRTPLISAWIGKGNYGDELMALNLRALLHESFGVQQVDYFQSGSFGVTPGPQVSVRCLRSSPVSFYQKLTSYYAVPNHDLLLYGGGSIFHSESSIEWKHRLLQRYRTSGKRKPAGAIGVSTGPFPTEAAYARCAAFFDELDFIVCRDAESAKTAATMTSPNKVSLCGDPALLTPLFFKDKMPDPTKRDPELVGVSFVRLKNDSGVFQARNLADVFLQIINELLQSKKRVRLFTLYTSEDMRDGELNLWLKSNAVDPGRVEIHTFNGDVFHALKKINDCSLMISMRLHALITAYMLNIPCLSIAYNPKNHNFMRMISGADVLSLDWNSPDLSVKAIHALRNQCIATRNTIQPTLFNTNNIKNVITNALTIQQPVK